MLGLRGVIGASLTGAPTVSTSVSGATVTVSWTHPGTARYPMNVYRNGAYLGTAGTAATGFPDSSLPAGTYNYQVAYVKNGVQMPFGNTATAVVVSSVPTPTNFYAQALSSSSIRLTWTNATAGATTLIERSIDGGVSYEPLNATTNQFYDDTSLGAGTYYYRIRAQVGSSLSGFTSAVSVTLNATSVSPPLYLAATALSDSSIQVTWTNSTSGVTTYVERSTNNVNFTSIGGTTSTFINDTGLSAGTYYYRAYHVLNGVSSSYTSSITIPLGSSATSVQGFQYYAVSPATTAIGMQWLTPPDSSYIVQIYRGDDKTTADDNDNFVDNVYYPTATAADYTLEPARTYTFSARYVRNGVAGSFVSFTRPTFPNTPTSISASPVSSSQVNVTVTKNSGEAATVIISRSTSQFGSYTDIATIPAGNFSGGYSYVFADSGLGAGTYYYRARARYTSLNSITVESGVTTTVSATVSSGPATPTLTLSPLVVDAYDDSVQAYYTVTNQPVGSYVQLSYNWVRYDYTGSYMDDNSVGWYTVSSSPALIYTGIDILSEAQLGGDTVEITVNLRLVGTNLTASQSTLFYTFALLGGGGGEDQ